MSARGARLALALAALAAVARAEYSSRSDAEYDFGDYRGRWCLDHLGFVYSVGDVYYPSAARCPCTCTADGPVCARPRCPRIHPRCTRVTYRSCCPVCETFSRVCAHRGKTYKVLEEFWLSPCEKCRCGYNMEVYCTVAECPGLHCVNPTYVPHQCCPVCKTGPNCFVGHTVIPAGVRVQVDEHRVCYCSYKEGTWEMHHQATCEVQERRSSSGATPEQTEHQLEPELESIP